MNVDQKIAFRQLLSDCLMFMAAEGRNQHEILSTQYKLEASVEKLIGANAGIVLLAADSFKFSDADRIVFRQNIAIALDQIGKRGITKEQVMKIIHDLEAWVEGQIDKWINKIARAAGKPRMNYRIDKRKN